MSFSIRDWQKLAFLRLIMANKSGESGYDAEEGTMGELERLASWNTEWKVLVYDKETRALISPVLGVSDLRSMGITVHTFLEAVRDYIPDVSAVYFVRPTENNIRLITEDIASGKYKDYSLNFSSSIVTPLMRTLASGCIEARALNKVTRVYDSYLSFSSLGPRLFTLNMSKAFSLYSSPTCTDDVATAFINSVTESLLGVLGCVGVVPIIVCQKGGPSELIGKELHKLCQDHLQSADEGIFSQKTGISNIKTLPNGRRPVPLGVTSNSRPYLILLDRNVDLLAPLAHSSKYHALVSDVLGPILSNRVYYHDKEDEYSADMNPLLAAGVRGSVLLKAPPTTGKTMAFEPEDQFWLSNCHEDFPTVVETHRRELEHVTREVQRLQSVAVGEAPRKTEQMGSLQTLGGGIGSSNAENAAAALKEIKHRKEILTLHSQLLEAVMSRLASRSIPDLLELEMKTLISGGTIGMDRNAVLEKIADPDIGAFEDKLRLAALHILSLEDSPTLSIHTGGNQPAFSEVLENEVNTLLAHFDQYFESMQLEPDATDMSEKRLNVAQSTSPQNIENAKGIVKSLFSYLKQLRLLPLERNKISASSSFSIPGGGGFFDRIAGATSTLVSKAAAQVSKFVSTDEKFTVTRIVEAICTGKSSIPGPASAVLESCLVMDPRSYGQGSRTYSSYVSAPSGGHGSSPHDSLAASRGGFSDAFVFMVGAGSWSEYGNLMKSISEDSQKQSLQQHSAAIAPRDRIVVYGCTDMVDPNSFLLELASVVKV